MKHQMKEYSQRTVGDHIDIGRYLTERSKEGWEVEHIQFGDGYFCPHCWYIILVRSFRKDRRRIKKNE